MLPSHADVADVMLTSDLASGRCSRAPGRRPDAAVLRAPQASRVTPYGTLCHPMPCPRPPALLSRGGWSVLVRVVCVPRRRRHGVTLASELASELAPELASERSRGRQSRSSSSASHAACVSAVSAACSERRRPSLPSGDETRSVRATLPALLSRPPAASAAASPRTRPRPAVRPAARPRPWPRAKFRRRRPSRRGRRRRPPTRRAPPEARP